MSTTDLAVVEQQPHNGLSLSDGPNPAQAVAYAAQVSTQIASVLAEGNGYVTIQRKKHITIEGWQSLAAMTGHSVEVQWSRPIEGMEPNGKGVRAWEARAVVTDQNGRVVAAGESMADPAESAPWTKSNFSVRSMAQTRAMSRALSSRMRYIVQLAGFAGTPAEEMSDSDREGAALQVARERFKVLRALPGQDNESVKAVIGDRPEVIAQDEAFAAAAHSLGWNAAKEADEPVEGEVVDEADDEPIISESQRKRLFAIAKEAGATEEWVKSVVLDLTGQDSRSKIPVSKYEAVIDAIQAGPAAEHVAAGGEALFPADPPRPNGDFL